MTLSCLHFSVCLGVLATPLMSFGSIFAANLLYFYCIYGFSSCISMVTKREDGPLLAVMGSLIIGILGGVAPPLSKVKIWHMEWLWRMSPGVSRLRRRSMLQLTDDRHGLRRYGSHETWRR